MSLNNRTPIQGCTNLRPQAVRAAKFYSVTLCICGSWKWNLAHVTILGPRILQRLLDFWKICGSLTLSILSLGSFSSTENPPAFSLLFLPWPRRCTTEPSTFLSIRSKCLIIRLHCHVRQRFGAMENNRGKNVSCLRFMWRLRCGTWHQVAGKFTEILVEHASTLRWYVPPNRPEPVRL